MFKKQDKIIFIVCICIAIFLMGFYAGVYRTAYTAELISYSDSSYTIGYDTAGIHLYTYD